MNLKEKAQELRKTVLEMCIKAGTGHLTSCFSCVEIMVALFYEIMKPEDIFILSKGHASPLLYAILADKGLIDKEELWKFASKGGLLGVHLDHNITSARVTAGSLGHGLGISIGLALSKRLNSESGMIYCLLGDGECYEGSVWEAAMFAGQEGLDNLTAIVDYNGLMVTEVVDLESLNAKWEAFNWSCELVDGHDLEALTEALSMKWPLPSVYIAETVKGKGIPFMEYKHLWHGEAPKGEDAERARRELAGKY